MLTNGTLAVGAISAIEILRVFDFFVFMQDSEISILPTSINDAVIEFTLVSGMALVAVFIYTWLKDHHTNQLIQKLGDDPNFAGFEHVSDYEVKGRWRNYPVCLSLVHDQAYFNSVQIYFWAKKRGSSSDTSLKTYAEPLFYVKDAYGVIKHEMEGGRLNYYVEKQHYVSEPPANTLCVFIDKVAGNANSCASTVLLNIRLEALVSEAESLGYEPLTSGEIRRLKLDNRFEEYELHVIGAD